MKLCIAGYLRVSSEGQTDGDGYPRQAASIEQFTNARGWSISVIAYDATRGANDLDDRLGLTGLMEYMAASAADRKIIVVEAQHRWAREVIISEMLLRECRKSGIEVWSAGNGVNLCEDGEDGTHKFIRQLMAVVDEFDKHRLVYRMRVARQRKKANTNGREGVEGRRPYGTRPGELRTLAVMHDLDLTRLSTRKIAMELNTRHLPTRAGTPWNAGTVWKVLHNPRSTQLLEEFAR
jgi:DNA invertase Pin-like site-specific DNA recombinase